MRRQLAHLIRLVAELHRDEDEECAVCQNRPTTVEFNCLHRLCAGCAREIFAYFGTCPFCREPILSLVRYVTHGPSELLQRPASPVPDAVQNPPFEDEFRVSIAISAEADARLVFGRFEDPPIEEPEPAQTAPETGIFTAWGSVRLDSERRKMLLGWPPNHGVQMREFANRQFSLDDMPSVVGWTITGHKTMRELFDALCEGGNLFFVKCIRCNTYNYVTKPHRSTPQGMAALQTVRCKSTDCGNSVFGEVVKLWKPRGSVRCVAFTA